jgi:hypothetical protein
MIDPSFALLVTVPTRSFHPGDFLMPVFPWRAVLSAILVSLTLGGCNANYKFNDSGYRPLGDPQAVNRGK